MFISVNPALGVKTLPELIALAKERPGKISNAVAGVGRLTHLTGELLQSEGRHQAAHGSLRGGAPRTPSPTSSAGRGLASRGGANRRKPEQRIRASADRIKIHIAPSG